MKSKIINLEEKELEVKRLPLRKYAELLGALKELPKIANSLAGKGTDELLQELPVLISASFPDFLRIFVIATDLTEQEAEELSLLDAVNVTLAIYEVNDYREVYEQIKKVLPQSSKENPDSRKAIANG